MEEQKNFNGDNGELEKVNSNNFSAENESSENTEKTNSKSVNNKTNNKLERNIVKDVKNATDAKNERIKVKNEEFIKEVLSNPKKKKKLRRRKEFWLILALLFVFLLGLGIGIYYYVDYSLSTKGGNLRVSVGIETKQIPEVITPGDSLTFFVGASNSANYAGDYGDGWSDIFFRYRIYLLVDGKEVPNAITDFNNSQNYLNNFINYNKQVEDGFRNELGEVIVKTNDGYSYYKGSLKNNEKVTIIENIKFSGEVLTEIVGGKNAEIVVEVEAIEAIAAVAIDRIAWEHAPHAWVTYIKDSFKQNHENIITKYNPKHSVTKFKIK